MDLNLTPLVVKLSNPVEQFERINGMITRSCYLPIIAVVVKVIQLDEGPHTLQGIVSLGKCTSVWVDNDSIYARISTNETDLPFNNYEVVGKNLLATY